MESTDSGERLAMVNGFLAALRLNVKLKDAEPP